MFLPAPLHFIYRSGSLRRQKAWLYIPYVAIACAMIALSARRVLVGNLDFNAGLFWDGMNAWPVLLAQDGFFFVLLLPLVVALYLKVKGGIHYSESIMFFIMINLWIPLLLFGFTTIANTAYRTVPLFVFFAMGIGTLFAAPVKKDPTCASGAVSYSVLALTLVAVLLTVISAMLPSLIPGIIFNK